MIEFNKYAVGAVIKRLRKSKNMSQEVLSGLAGLARSHVAMIESSDKKANFETLWKIANAFDILPSKLVEMIEKEAELLNSQNEQ
ncbi:MAG: helix-turn-helix transcriptional regulator [Faecalibacterium sp.]|nr:helix-turn-helix transcriptional regulator [Ruminococcus sp.]MCM1392594.1 helix-turn-helix transcriptional regulator [Ruminococcus sp.]MCM1486286.1 helix-turn-helix transcriptional regulator [Faecalibacterium sp.]